MNINAQRRWLRGVFSLNDGRWGRGDEPSSSEGDSGSQRPGNEPPNQPQPPKGSRRPGGNSQDLDEVWRDVKQKLGSLFGDGRGGKQPPSGGNGSKPDMSGAGLGIGVAAVIAVLVWLGTGFFTVQEGQQAVITHFGSYKAKVDAGLHWRWPYPIERNERVVTRIQSADVGRDSVVRSTGLRESAMLTEDENIVEIKFAVQFRVNDARAYLYESRAPEETVVQVAETAVREVIGKMKMDAALADERDQIAPRVRKLMQDMLERYKVGIDVVGINLQQGGVRPPEKVQDAFDDVLKAGQERERSKNEAQAYANDVVPRAAGTASRLKEEADGYKARVVAQAQGDAQRFSQVLVEYQKAPQVTRDRMYIDTMRQVYANATKVLVDTRQNANLLYLPIDKLMQISGQQGGGASSSASAGDSSAAANSVQATAPSPVPSAAPVGSPRARDERSRDRELR